MNHCEVNFNFHNEEQCTLCENHTLEYYLCTECNNYKLCNHCITNLVQYNNNRCPNCRANLNVSVNVPDVPNSRGIYRRIKVNLILKFIFAIIAPNLLCSLFYCIGYFFGSYVFSSRFKNNGFFGICILLGFAIFLSVSIIMYIPLYLFFPKCMNKAFSNINNYCMN